MEDIRSDRALAPLCEYPAFKALFEGPVVVVARKPGID